MTKTSVSNVSRILGIVETSWSICSYPPAPACQGPPGWEARSVQSLISYPNCFSIFHHQFINLCKFPLTNQQLIHQLVINLLFAGLQVSNLGLLTVPPGASIYPPAPRFTQLGVVLKTSEISMHIQYTRKSQKWSPKTSKSVQNEVPRGT